MEGVTSPDSYDASTQIALLSVRASGSTATSSSSILDAEDCIDRGACIPECPWKRSTLIPTFLTKWSAYVQLQCQASEDP